MSAPARLWLVGEHNPYSRDPRHDLYPDPVNSAGWRLCERILRMGPREYLRGTLRRNLLRTARWSAPGARRAARELAGDFREGDAVVLLGARVRDAFGLSGAPPLWRALQVVDGALLAIAPIRLAPPPILGSAGELARRGVALVLLPHPSGRCLAWNPGPGESRGEPARRARVAVRLAAPWVADQLREPALGDPEWICRCDPPRPRPGEHRLACRRGEA